MMLCARNLSLYERDVNHSLRWHRNTNSDGPAKDKGHYNSNKTASHIARRNSSDNISAASYQYFLCI